jgi:hypothetical protein
VTYVIQPMCVVMLICGVEVVSWLIGVIKSELCVLVGL